MVNQATQAYIREHADADVRQLALRGTKDPEVDLAFALDQISGRQKARIKLPLWAAHDAIIYPPHLSMEQCSSEPTARYKRRVIGDGCWVMGDRQRVFVDLTGGFGVDFSFMAEGFERAVYVERQSSLCDIAVENLKTLGLTQAEVVCADGTDYLHALEHASLIYLDPARRDIHGARTYGMADCTPNVLELKDELLAKADYVLLKLSPMLDWRKAVVDLGCVSEVHIVSVDNECKELLLVVNCGNTAVNETGGLRVVCVNLLPDGCEERFEFDALSPSPITHHLTPTTQKYLFEPNASVMKAGCFQWVEHQFDVCQLETCSHLFVADADRPDFPGRRFIIEQIVSMNKRELKTVLADISCANIAVRNFPLSVADLRKRLKLKDGGEVYIFATTVADKGHRLFICRKIVGF